MFSKHPYDRHNMLFIFDSQACVQDYPTALDTFSNLTELELFGGGFYDHKIAQFLQTKGFQLRSLTFMSVKQIDYRGMYIVMK